MTSTGLVSGQVGLVTGAGSGMGRATALLLAEEGAAAVVVADLVAESIAETAELVEERGAQALAVPTDVSDSAAVDALVRRARDHFGPLSSAINCAGVAGDVKSILDYTDDEWDRVLGVNLSGIFYCMRAEIRSMVADGAGGAIVNIASASAVDPIPNLAPYSASKKGVLGLTRAVAGEFIGHGIRVNGVLPGGTRTAMLEEHVKTEQGQRHVAGHPMKRLAEPRELAEAIVWLCSPRASYVTGAEFLIDGGSHGFWH